MVSAFYYLRYAHHCSNKRQRSWSGYAKVFEKPIRPDSIPVLKIKTGVKSLWKQKPTTESKRGEWLERENDADHSQQQQGEKESQQSPSSCRKHLEDSLSFDLTEN